MKALILAAGYATRLYPLTKERPKSLLTIGDKPIIEYIIDNLKEIEGINEIIIVSNHRFFNQFKDWLNGISCVKKISLVNDGTTSEKDRLGAVGDMNFAINECNITDDLLVIGGDNFLTGDLRGFLEFSEQKQSSALGLFDIKDRKMATRYGVVMLDGNSRLIDFSEKPKVPFSTLIAMCLYYFCKEKLHLVSKYLNPVRNTKLSQENKISNGINPVRNTNLSQENKISNGVKRNEARDAIGHYINWLSRVDGIFGYIFNGIWYDIGDKLSYQRARKQFETVNLK